MQPVADTIGAATVPSVVDSNNNNNPHRPKDQVDADTVYEFYSENVIPAITSSLPILLGRIVRDSTDYIKLGGSKFLRFLLPKHWADSVDDHRDYYWTNAPGSNTIGALNQLWEQTMRNAAAAKTALATTTNSNNATTAVQDFLLRNFDTNQDGHISAAELMNMTEFMERWHASVTTPSSWYEWVSREWPLMDWKVGVFLWRTFGGIILTLCVLSIIPGRLHGISARILRWPVLAVTYFLIGVELCVYVVIRLGIRLAETVFAKPKHRALRRKMAQAKSYDEWYALALQLDKSQRRDKWQSKVDAKTSKRYNWSFIMELIKDMKVARETNDSLLALAVLQQCTRKNVGGIMSEDLFSYTNTGEPMHIVRDFIEEVATTMEWVTDEALKLPDDSTHHEDDSSEVMREYAESLDQKVRIEKDKTWKSLIRFATTFSFDEKSHNNNNNQQQQNRQSISNTTATPTTDLSVSSLESMSEAQKQTALKTVTGTTATTPVDPAKAISDDPSLTNKQLPSIHRRQVIDFFKRARAAYGRTALCLSGGATMGVYHFGHVRGLLEAGLLPNIISGTSAGSVVGAVICTRTDEEIIRDMNPETMSPKLICFGRPWTERMKSLVKNGHMFSFEEWLELIKWFTMGDMTFEEAYRKTGRLFCITVSATTKKAPPVLLNHLSAPNVTIASAIVASAAVPGFIPPVKLQYKLPDGRIRESSRDQTYFDGSIDSDIPVNGLAEMLNCQFFIAAQCNPHVVPFFFNPKGGVGRPSRWSSGGHEHSWRGGFLLATLEMYLKNDMKAKFRFLHDMEAAVGFTSTLMTQEFHGSITLVPQVSFIDFTKLLSNLSIEDMYRHFLGGSISAYEHIARIKMHYRIADTLDYCLEALHSGKRDPQPDRPVIRLELNKPSGKDRREPRDPNNYENDTLSTHSSMNGDEDDDADADTCPTKTRPSKE